ncbi:MAG: hypothetical protein IKL53_01550 [Lachnospiraceae bacterium]|nr:hypothetical protein [Lachnospiraceae bacterium]
MANRIVQTNTQYGLDSIDERGEFAYKATVMQGLPIRYHKLQVFNQLVDENDTAVICSHNSMSFRFAGSETFNMNPIVEKILVSASNLANSFYRDKPRNEVGLIQVILYGRGSDGIEVSLMVGSKLKDKFIVPYSDFYSEGIELNNALSNTLDNWVNTCGANAGYAADFRDKLLELPKLLLSVFDYYGKLGIGRVSIIGCHPFGIDLWRAGSNWYTGVNMMTRELWNNNPTEVSYASVIPNEYQVFFFRTARR